MSSRSNVSFKSALALAALALLQVECGSDNPASPSVNYDGAWAGTTSQNLPITFTVSGNTVTAISVQVRASMAGSSCTYTTGSQDKPTIANNAFSLKVGGGTVSSTLLGTFSSATAATGSIEAFSISGLACGSVLVFGTPSSQGAKTWQATKQ
jgi:hypothetical protein